MEVLLCIQVDAARISNSHAGAQQLTMASVSLLILTSLDHTVRGH